MSLTTGTRTGVTRLYNVVGTVTRVGRIPAGVRSPANAITGLACCPTPLRGLKGARKIQGSPPASLARYAKGTSASATNCNTSAGAKPARNSSKRASVGTVTPPAVNSSSKVVAIFNISRVGRFGCYVSVVSVVTNGSVVSMIVSKPEVRTKTICLSVIAIRSYLRSYLRLLKRCGPRLTLLSRIGRIGYHGSVVSVGVVSATVVQAKNNFATLITRLFVS
mmetsp:Transcript_26716/g.63717  ORF Transcript_26716/g.63717 Transcript_26716/m.63717 type:complete len:221 (-) Transcript_26716:55-717(-)